MGQDEYGLSLTEALGTVTTVLKSQTTALSNLTNLSQIDSFSKKELKKTLILLQTCLANNGKIILCGIGKSFKISSKISATLNSLSLHSSLLHPSEALHGDLGMIQNKDCLIFVTASGNTQELISLLPHIRSEVPIVLLTCSKQSKLSSCGRISSLLYAEIPPFCKEEIIYDIPAPTISTTLMLSLADATSIALAQLHRNDITERKRLFGERHPGGSIGENYFFEKALSSHNSLSSSATTIAASSSHDSSVMSLSAMLQSHHSSISSYESEITTFENSTRNDDNNDNSDSVNIIAVDNNAYGDKAIVANAFTPFGFKNIKTSSTIPKSELEIHRICLKNDLFVLSCGLDNDFGLKKGEYAIETSTIYSFLGDCYSEHDIFHDNLFEWHFKKSLKEIKTSQVNN